MIRRMKIILCEMIRGRMIIHLDGEKEEKDPLCDDQKGEDDEKDEDYPL